MIAEWWLNLNMHRVKNETNKAAEYSTIEFRFIDIFEGASGLLEFEVINFKNGECNQVSSFIRNILSVKTNNISVEGWYKFKHST